LKNRVLLVFILYFLLIMLIANIDLATSRPLVIQLADTYRDNAPADSIEGARGMSYDSRGFVVISAFTDDSVTVLNVTDPTSIGIIGSVSDAAGAGSVDGIWWGSLDDINKYFYTASTVDDIISIYSITTGNPSYLTGTTAAVSANTPTTGSLDNGYQNIFIDIGTTRFCLISAGIDDTVTVYNCTSVVSAPTNVSYRNTAANPCSFDNVRNLEAVPGTTMFIAASFDDDVISVLNLSTAGVISCIDDITDSAGATSLDNVQDFYFENSTRLIYALSPADGYLTIINASTSISSGGALSFVGSVSSVTEKANGGASGSAGPVAATVATINGTKYAFVGTTNDTYAGIHVVNVTNPANPSLYSKFSDVGGSGCAYNEVYSLLFRNNYLFVTSAVDFCLYSIRLSGDSPMNITLSVPADNYTNDTLQFVNLTFNATVTDNDGLANCSLWTNYSGTWQLNQTQLVGGVSNTTSFNLSGLTNRTFIWNIDCRDIYSYGGLIDSDRMVILNWTPFVDKFPNITLVYPEDNYFNDIDQFVNLTFNATVTDDIRIINCSLWTNYSGTWQLNQTQLVGGVSNTTSFNLSGLTNRTFIWNVQCYDNATQYAFATSNWTVILNWVPPPDTNFSVQKYHFTLGDGTTTAYRPFTGGQTGLNTVPFVTMSVNASADTWNLFLPDVYFNSTGVIVNRGSGAGSVMNLIVSVVEFDSDSVRVKRGNFSLGTGGVTTPIGAFVNLSNTALIFYYNSTDVTDGYNDNSIMGNISGINELNFTSQGATGTTAGHWYVFESRDGGFTVQNTVLAFASGSTYVNGSISDVDTSKSFVITSYVTNEAQDDPRDGSFYANLTNSTTVTGVRIGAPVATILANVYVVTFNGNQSVKRGHFSYAAGAGTASDTVSLVNLSSSVIWNPVLTGRMSDDGATNAIESSFQLLNLTSNTTISGFRAETSGNAVGIWEIIDWYPYGYPRIDYINVDDDVVPVGQIVLSAGSTRFINCTVVASDSQGADNIAGANATFHYHLNRSSDPDNNLTHYTNSSCSVINSTSTNKTFLCGFYAYYYASNGTWHCNATVSNGYAFSSIGNASTIVMALYAVNVTNGLIFGNVSADSPSSEFTANVTNFGNMPINITLQGYARTQGDNIGMNCSDNTNITITNIRFSLASSVFASKTSLTGAQQQSGLSMLRQTTLSQINNITYWQAQPDPGPRNRTCSGNIIFSAEQS
jgi:hypothetical protein